MGATLFFDLDGTLTDPAPGITGCIRHALEQLGFAPPASEELLWCIGPPLQESFRRLVGEAAAGRALTLYRERYAEIGLYENQVYPGIEDTLLRLRGEGATLHVASSKPHVYVERILDHFALREHFVGVYGSELDGTRTDKSELLAHALGQCGASAQESTMIGDRSHDAIGARRNGMPFVGVLYGYGSLDELRAAGASRWVERPRELADLA